MPVSQFEFYVGGHVGFATAHRQGCFEVFPYADFPANCDDYFAEPFSYTQKGGLIGAQTGVNYGLGGGLVIGAEVNASVTGITGNLEDVGGVGDWKTLATATAKLGWAFHPNWMIYAKAGLALADFDFEDAFGCKFQSTHQGSVFGVGTEFMTSNHNSWFIEWNRLQFQDKESACSTLIIVALPTTVHNDSPRIDLVRFGFNHYFN